MKKLIAPTKPILDDTRKLYVSACVDSMGTNLASPEEEYREIQRWIEDVTHRTVQLKIGVLPWNLERCDIYVFDYGGMLPGCDDLVFSLYRTFMEKVVEMPNTIFVIFSSFSAEMYKIQMRQECPELKDAPNVILGADDKLIQLLEV